MGMMGHLKENEAEIETETETENLKSENQLSREVILCRMIIHQYTVKLTKEGKAFNDMTTLVQIEMTKIKMIVELLGKIAG